jgi:3'-phosphoadenosine 5'-phosphosulfate sulfotransferase (PAPS reductase)/FAD synthetase
VNLTEPILREDDRRAWAYWERVCDVHARTPSFQRRVEQAKAYVREALELEPGKACVMWSAGKDSTCLAYLVTVEMGLRHVELVSQKDDLDFPGEEEFVHEHAAAWGAKLTVVRPDISALGYVREHMCEFDEDLHSRQAGLSKAVFYNVVDKANSQFDLVMMGMRAEESRARKWRMHTHGAVMRLKSGRVRANPLALWTGLDVLTYTHTRKVPMLQLYRCIAYMHDRKPWNIRKSWWIYGKNPNNIAWLRHYYPSLHRTWSSFMPNVSVIG